MDVLKGYRTYVVAALLSLVGLVNLLTGEMTLTEFLGSPDLVVLLNGLGFAALRAGVASK